MRSDRHPILEAMVYPSTCHVVAPKSQPDRFFLDMRVYEIRSAAIAVPDAPLGDMVWYGLYVAIEVGPQVPTFGNS